ncbi:type 4a pilus biogenesis protein PilO [Bythopirellula polymerisocia]|uniref:Pilus assembly protein, PilO n=1 Tax=Bythopirellula polymerisocia TaxID=2528003 RepID=A0A5C6CZU6_9BACT|nr:type 4a pilus biogenesis protein PilO [Bythopirellula polymerisocia]TWU29455.1 Pilus assembly protein, PilO [Bythopirellula polymerisocia]
MRNYQEKQVASLGWALHVAGVLVVLVFVGAYFALVTRPLNTQLDQSTSRVAQLKEVLKRAPQVRSAYSQSKAELQALKASVEETLLRLPAELDENEFIEQVNSVALASGVKIVGHQSGLTERLESYSKAYVTFQCKGSFASICRFLHGIDHLPRLTEVSQLEIESDKYLERYPIQVNFVLYFGGNSHDRSMRGEVL